MEDLFQLDLGAGHAVLCKYAAEIGNARFIGALAQADIGIAMGVRGTDSAIEAADIAVMDDRISSIASLVRLSRMTHSVLVQNIVFALGVKIAFALLAIAGYATMWMAVFADVGTALLVVANGLRAMRQ